MEKILYCKDKRDKKRLSLFFSCDKTTKLQDIAKKNHPLVVVSQGFLKRRKNLNLSNFSGKICLIHFSQEDKDNERILRQSGSFDYFTDQDSKAVVSFKLKRAKQLLVLRKKISDLEIKLLERDKKIEELILVDPLTKCYNWRYFLNRVTQEINRSQRHSYELSFIAIDIDHFRRINELYGFKVADIVIKQLVGVLRRRLRKEDVLVRWREDEFFIIVPYLAYKDAYKVAQRIKDAIGLTKFKYRNISLSIKASVGVVSLCRSNVTNGRDVVSALSKCITMAKRKGGNAIVLYGQAKMKPVARQRDAGTIGDLQGKIEKMNVLLTRDLLEMIYGFARAIEAKDSYTGRHVEDTAVLAREVAASLNLPKKEIEDVQHAAVLHDLGKVGISENILSKKGALSHKEREVIKTHPSIAAEILREIHSLRGAVPAILYHHERYDGGGYPLGLHGDEIPLSARIVAVADVYQALISDRPYRKAFNKNKAMAIIKNESGKQFDPRVVKMFLKAVKRVNEEL